MKVTSVRAQRTKLFIETDNGAFVAHGEIFHGGFMTEREDILDERQSVIDENTFLLLKEAILTYTAEHPACIRVFI